MPNRPPKKKNKTMSEQSENKPGITLNDFSVIIRIIDVASRRGAFEGKELSSVGNVRDKVEAFLSFYAPKQDGEGEAAAVKETPTEEPAVENTEGE